MKNIKTITFISIFFIFIMAFIFIYHNEINRNISHAENIKMETISINQFQEVTYKIINNTNYSYLYGLSFALDIKYRNEWISVNFLPERGNFVAIAFTLYPKSYIYGVKDLYTNFGLLAPGEYRIVKEVDRIIDNDKLLFREFLLTTEFTLQ